MEVFTTEIQMRNPDPFPEKISPFPSSLDSLLAACEVSGVSTPDITPFPPQKLRPIRCNWKSAFVYRSSNNSNEEVFKFQGSGEFGGQSGLEEVVGLGELGFVSSLRDGVSEGGQDFPAGEVLKPVGAEGDMDMRRIGKVEIKRENYSDDSSSSSESELSGYVVENAQASDTRKRRKRTRERLEGYMEEVASKVLLKQEMMYNKLMEMLERKEKERSIREETWKQREMERRRREERVRAQETARNVALIEFIQNIMGQDFQMAQPLHINKPSTDEAEVYQQRDE